MILTVHQDRHTRIPDKRGTRHNRADAAAVRLVPRFAQGQRRCCAFGCSIWAIDAREEDACCWALEAMGKSSDTSPDIYGKGEYI